MSGEWQPIETAPRDYTEVIGLMGPKRMELVWYFAPSSQTFGWMNARGRRCKPQPTHWMPIPPEAGQ
jgi:hypothetical protein